MFVLNRGNLATQVVLLVFIFSVSQAATVCHFGDICPFPCHCNGSTSCDPKTGSCGDVGCDGGDDGSPDDYLYTTPWTGPGCQIGNVALQKTATQGPRTLFDPAPRAVDGNHNPSSSRGSCAAASTPPGNNEPAWWEVDLGDDYIIISIVITNRNLLSSYLLQTDVGTRASGDPPDVYNLTSCEGIEDMNPYAKVTLECPGGVLARYVRLQGRKDVGNWEHIHFCEVEVIGFLYRACACPEGPVSPGCLCIPWMDEVTNTPNVTSTSSNGGLSSAAAAGVAVAVIVVVVVLLLVILLVKLKPDIFCKSREPRLGEDDDLSSIYANIEEEVSVKPIALRELLPFVRATHESPLGFQTEHNEVLSLSSKLAKQSVAEDEEWYERLKNIYENESDAYVFKVYGSHRKHYIVLQGNQTAPSVFWEFVWLSGIDSIVAFGNDVQQSILCAGKHGPSDLEICIDYVEEFSEFAVQHVTMYNAGAKRQVQVCVYLSWADGAIPENAAAIVDFRRKLRQKISTAELEIVITSDNLDRSGVFLAIDYSLDQALAEGSVDVIGYVNHLLSTCKHLAFTKEQYGFVYDAVLEHWESKNTATLVDLFSYNEGRQSKAAKRQYQVIDVLRNISLIAAQRTYREKARYSNMPGNSLRPVIYMDADSMGDNINASYVNAYKTRRAYIATSAPTTTTIGDIWRLIYDTGARTIIMLNQLSPEEDVPPYWPSESEPSFSVGKLTITRQDEAPEDGDIMTRLMSVKYEGEEEIEVKQFHLQSWTDTEDIPNDGEGFQRVLELASVWNSHHATSPILVHCRDGVQKSGVCCAAMFMIDHLQTEQLVDVFHAVRRVQASRPRFIISQDQYVFLYRFITNFIESSQDYISITVASNHLQGPHRESPKAMRKLSDTLIDGHLGQRRYQSRKNDHI